MDSLETFLPFFPPPLTPDERHDSLLETQPRSSGADGGFIVTLKNILAAFKWENNPFKCPNKWKKKLESDKTALKQRTFNSEITGGGGVS